MRGRSGSCTCGLDAAIMPVATDLLPWAPTLCIAYVPSGDRHSLSKTDVRHPQHHYRHIPPPCFPHLLRMPPLQRKQVLDGALSEENDEEMLSGQDEYSSDASGSNPSEPNTEDEIADAKLAKSKKTLKRKRRATDAVNFGATLQSLLSTDAPAAPLSLKPSVAKKRKEEKLEAKGKHVLQVEKKEKEDKGRITDVIGGWGGESERALRKVAQRGGTHGGILLGLNALANFPYACSR